MIVDILGVPQLSLLEARVLCEYLGLKIGHLTRKLPYFVAYRPSRPSYFGPLRLVYINDIDIFNQYVDTLYRKPQQHVVLVNVAKSTLEELGVKIHSEGEKPFTFEDLRSCLYQAPVSTPALFLARKTDIAKQVMQGINKESLLGKLQTTFYRIKQVEDRQAIKNVVYAYLGGSIKKMPATDVPILDKILATDLCKKFILAVAFAKKEGPDSSAEKFGIDRFELAFVLKVTGHSFD